MNRGLYIKLASQNIRTNRSTFFPFSFSCIAMVALFYMLSSIKGQVSAGSFTGQAVMELVLQFGKVVIGIFSFFVIIYTNSFLMKRRSREFGLYSILGMEKKHIGKVVFWEIVLTGAASILLGLFVGVLFSKLIFLLLLSILGIKTGIAFAIDPGTIGEAGLLFAGIFVFVLLMNNIRVFRLKPLELMRGSRVGEQEPKAKWLFAILGVICLGIGYYIALTTDNPITALSTFFLAVLFVIAGTYLLFISGSIALLKCLKKSKAYYYHKNHFITVSGIMYRMKQNAVGLANICILSTAALVVISTTVSLYVGIQDVLRSRYPYDVLTSYNYLEDEGEYFDYSILSPVIEESAAAHHVSILEEETYYSYNAFGSFNDDTYIPEALGTWNSLNVLSVVCLEDYNAMTGEKAELLPDEVLVKTGGGCKISRDTITVMEREFQIKGEASAEDVVTSSYPIVFLVVADLDVMMDIRDIINAANMDINNTVIQYNYDFNLSGTLEDKQAFCTELRDTLNAAGIAHLAEVENIYTVRDEIYQLYGSLFFIGIFIGMLFLITTAMIIYYKQISEGYDDRERFVILQKVGMGSREIKRTIKNQILIVFFLPILMAVIHICFAFDCIKKILFMFNLNNVAIFVGCTAGTIVIFFIVYAVIYRLTAKIYYRIVNS